jgi:hypothetical protein
MKGPGMQWAREHVSPLVALRTVACSDLWAEAWLQIVQHMQQYAWQRRVQHQRCRQPSHPSTALSSLLTPQVVALLPAPHVGGASTPRQSLRTCPSRPKVPKAPELPPPNHS